MAVDKKSEHVGNHGGRYTDMDGQTKQFTYIDHDPKTSIATVPSYEGATKEWQETKDKLVEELLSLPASAANSLNGRHEILVKRNIEEGKIEWIEEAVRILAETDYWQLVHIKNSTKSRFDID